MRFEQGPIRPPSEAASLLLRVTRNCPWNKCAFCLTYKGKKFSRRPVEEVLNDINAAKNVYREIQELSWRWGGGGKVTPEVAHRLRESYDYQYLHVATWMYFGGKTVFLQDADSLILKTGKLVEILQAIKEAFPAVERITTYARAKTVSRKTVEELKELRRAGLSRIHMGLESGSDEVLKFIHKGATAGDMIQAGHKIRQAGISLCFYVILGLGGVERSREHALETARVINAVNPNYVRFRTLSVLPETPLAEKVSQGLFEPLHEDDIVKEERLLIENLRGIESMVVSDHALNLLEEVQGKLPDEKAHMLEVIEQYLSLSDQERKNYRLGRRAGVYRYLADMRDPRKYDYVAKGVRQLEETGELEKTIDHLRRRL